MYVDIDYHSKNQDFTETVLLRDKITFNNWTTLIMRVQSKANLSVSVNCHPVVIKQLAGRFPVIPSDSEFRIIQSIEKNIWTMTKEVGDIFQVI